MRHNLIRAIIAIYCSVNVATVHAGGATGGATEFTQIANNLELIEQVRQNAEAYTKQIEQYATQLKQYANMLKHTEKIASEAIGTALGPFRDLVGDIGIIHDEYLDAQHAIKSAVGSVRANFRNMQKLDMTLEEYVLSEGQLARARDAQHTRDIERNIAAINKAILKAEKVRDHEAMIQDITGNVKGFQTLAQQNQMIIDTLMSIQVETLRAANARSEEQSNYASSKAAAVDAMRDPDSISNKDFAEMKAELDAASDITHTIDWNNVWRRPDAGTGDGS